MADFLQLLPLCANRFDGVVQLMLGCPQMFFRSCAMPSHIVVVGFAGMIQLMDRFLHMFVDRFQIVPVAHPISDRDSSNERQTHGQNGNGNRLLHSFLSIWWIKFSRHARILELSPTANLLSKGNRRILL